MSSLKCIHCELDIENCNESYECDFCSQAFHEKCTGLTASEMKVMLLKKKRTLKFLCPNCNSGMKWLPTLMNMFKSLRDEFASLRSELRNIKSTFTGLSSIEVHAT